MPKGKLASDGTFLFECPGCGNGHGVNTRPNDNRPVWGWNGSEDAPTFTPSILLRSGHHAPGWTGPKCWCTFNAEHPEMQGKSFECVICHSFVTDGKIQFLGDCTHKLAGQTVELPEWDEA